MNMHAKTALPCAWALGSVLLLAGCASRGHSTTHPLDLLVAPSVVASARPPAWRTPSPPSVVLLRTPGETSASLRSIPLGRGETVQPALAAPTLRARPRPAPCALTPELMVRRPAPRAAAADYDVPILFEQARLRSRARAQPDAEVGACAGGT